MSAENGQSFTQNVKDAGARTVAREILRHEERLFGGLNFSYTPSFDEIHTSFVDAHTNGFHPVVYTNHQAHADVFAHAAMADGLTYMSTLNNPEAPIPGFVLPFATSLRTGHQGAFLQEFLKTLEPLAAQKNLILLPYTRPKDEAAGLDQNKIAFLRKLTEYINNGYGLMLLPEGNVDGGRLKSDATTPDDINGMQRFTSDFALIMRILAREGKQPLFIPAAIHGTYKWQSKEKRRGAIGPILTLLFTYNELPSIDVTMGKPFYLPDINEKIKQLAADKSKDAQAAIRDELGNILAPHVAHMLPKKAQGVWAA